MEGVGDEVLVLSTVLAIGGGLLLLIGRNQRTNTQLQPAPPPREAGVRENSTRDPAHMPSTASVTVDCRVVDGDSRKIAVPIPCTFGEIKQMVGFCRDTVQTCGRVMSCACRRRLGRKSR
jgi:hypothetical protein